MWDAIKKNLVRPLGEQIGTKIAIAIAPFGVHAETSEMITIGVIGVLLVAVDLVAARYKRKAAEPAP